MAVIKEVDFDHAGRSYKIKVSYTGAKYIVRAYLDGKEANPYSHSISVNEYENFNVHFKTNAIKFLIQDAKLDITERRWEKLSKILMPPKKNG